MPRQEGQERLTAACNSRSRDLTPSAGASEDTCMHVPPVHTHRNKRKQTVNKKRESRPSPTITAACSLTVARNVERCLRSCSQSFPPLWTVPSAVWPAHPWLIYVPFFLCFVIETGNETKTPLFSADTPGIRCWLAAEAQGKER